MRFLVLVLCQASTHTSFIPECPKCIFISYHILKSIGFFFDLEKHEILISCDVSFKEDIFIFPFSSTIFQAPLPQPSSSPILFVTIFNWVDDCKSSLTILLAQRHLELAIHLLQSTSLPCLHL